MFEVNSYAECCQSNLFNLLQLGSFNYRLDMVNSNTVNLISC